VQSESELKMYKGRSETKGKACCWFLGNGKQKIVEERDGNHLQKADWPILNGFTIPDGAAQASSVYQCMTQAAIVLYP
jgi:hypothetical protein